MRGFTHIIKENPGSTATRAGVKCLSAEACPSTEGNPKDEQDGFNF